MFEPAYIKLYKSGELKTRVKRAVSILESCVLCPRRCGINRLADERGFCGTGRLPIISSFGPHFGEEAPLVGINGSGTIFISGCNLKCAFCQNFEISHKLEGEEITQEGLAKIMLHLQGISCHNINIVTPTHVVPQILESLPIAIDGGLNLPLVYNTGGYDSIETIKLLDGIFDIYMPDFKFASNEVAERFTNAIDYPEVAKEAIKEMHRQVGDLIIEDGVAKRGLLVRHLVLPDGLAGTNDVVKFIASISKHTYLNIMDQYRPCGDAYRFHPLNRVITIEEFESAIRIADEVGLHRLDKRKTSRFIYYA
ncbi:MAG: 4Fe-4S cluster-binding domain-containing protein [bacterium]|nr:4Fe-4S cluster-binding domain-containing protein [bacterium]